MQLHDFNTLAEAQAHIEINPELIHRDTMNGILGLGGVYSAMKKIAFTEGHPAQNAMDAFMDSLEFNFKNGEPGSTGEVQKTAFDNLIAANITVDMAGTVVQVSAVLNALKPVILAKANPTTTPFLNRTQHDFDLAKGTISRTQVTVEQGFCTITTSADAPRHNPQIYRRITFTNGSFEFVRVAGFRDVEAANTYRVQCPNFPDLWVDDAYNLVS